MAGLPLHRPRGTARVNTSPEDRLSLLRKRLQDRICVSRYRTWFGESTELHLHENGLDVWVKNKFVADWIANNYMEELVEVTRELFGGSEAVTVRIIPDALTSATTGNNGDRA